jgi:hypothetical protein
LDVPAPETNHQTLASLQNRECAHVKIKGQISVGLIFLFQRYIRWEFTSSKHKQTVNQALYLKVLEHESSLSLQHSALPADRSLRTTASFGTSTIRLIWSDLIDSHVPELLTNHCKTFRRM